MSATGEPRTLEVLLQTSPRAAEAIVERLCAEGVEAEIVDRPSSLALLLAFGTYRVRIGVPPEQLAAARGVMDRWEPQAQANVAALSRVVYRQFLLAALPCLLLLAVHGWVEGRVRPFVWGEVLLVWLASFVGLALWGRRAARSARPRTPTRTRTRTR